MRVVTQAMLAGLAVVLAVGTALAGAGAITAVDGHQQGSIRRAGDQTKVEYA